MSLSPKTSQASSSSKSDSPFDRFWGTRGKESVSQDAESTQQGALVGSSKQSGSRVKRLLRFGSNGSTNDASKGDAGTTRRKQVYEAQKRHRDRKAEYISSLETEVARLQHLEAEANTEKTALSVQNQAIREFLARQPLDVQLDSIDLGQSPTGATDVDESMLDFATLDFRLDPDMLNERLFTNLFDADSAWTSTESGTSGDASVEASTGAASVSPPTTKAEGVLGDSWAALDFILALEWPCKAHVRHHAIKPDTAIPQAYEPGRFNGHGMTATSAVLSSAQPPPRPLEKSATPSQHGLDTRALETWRLPHSEIDRLVKLSQDLELDDELLTPAQAYSAVRENVPSADMLIPALQELREPLGRIVKCAGWGAIMPADQFWHHLDTLLPNLTTSSQGPA